MTRIFIACLIAMLFHADIVTAKNIPSRNDAEVAIKDFVIMYYNKDVAGVQAFLERHWHPNTRNDIYLRGFSATAIKADIESIDVVFGERHDNTLIVTAHVTGAYADREFLATFVFTIQDNKIIKLLPVEKTYRRERPKQPTY